MKSLHRSGIPFEIIHRSLVKVVFHFMCAFSNDCLLAFGTEFAKIRISNLSTIKVWSWKIFGEGKLGRIGNLQINLISVAATFLNIG